jgi:2,2-dialkylglycine decarboxylase (pyruvate)
LQQLKSSSDGTLAAVIVEPVMSSGGVVEAPFGYLKNLALEVRKLGGLFVLDESQTGLGKLGSMFGYQQHDIIPDIMTLGKHFGAGVPISVLMTTEEIASRCLKEGFMVVGSHFSDPLSCVAGLASLEIIRKENLINKAKANGEFVANRLSSLMERLEIIGDVRGKGGLFGVELVEDRRTKSPAVREAFFIAKRCLELGLVIGVRGIEGRRNVLRLVPPLVCDHNSLEEGLNILDQALSEAKSQRLT